MSDKHDERKLAELRLQTQYAVTRALAESNRLREAAPEILRAVCESLGWEYGALWRVDREADVLRCVQTWHLPSLEITEFEDVSKRQPFMKGVGLPGRVWESGEPAWLTSVVLNGNFPRAPIAEKEGLHAGFAFPVSSKGEILGVMEFFTREMREPDEDVLHMMGGVGGQIGQFIVRMMAEEARRESEERFRALAETASDAIISIDEASRIIYVNHAGENIFGYAIEEMLGADLTMLMPDYLRHLHRAGLNRYLETGEKHISWDGVELPGLHKDGHEIPVEISFSEFSRNGKRYFTGIIRDVTERKRAEEELRRLYHERELMLEEVSTPLVPVWRGVLAMPLIGSLDTERMQRATDAALGEVVRTGARACIIDITGARIIDSQAVSNLDRLVSSLRLIGAEAIVTGVTAHAAQTLVGLGVDFAGMRTHRTLAEALAELIKNHSDRRDMGNAKLKM
ncbi:MAG: PAS domain S-box protein [Acidobacteria bacterium]|nr:PAS domain S-box protein [Acidobacteriota bacterium]